MSQVSESMVAAKATRPVSRAGWMVAAVGTVIGLAIMGDSLLYGVLPLAAPGLGISLPLVGVLLSANRFVRLVSNRWAGQVYERFGPRRPFLAAVGIGIVSTFLYNPLAGFVLFLAARLLWGIAWSGLRQGGYQAVWSGRPETKGRLTGLLWGLIRLGSAISVLAGGLLYDRFGYGAALGLAIAAALLAAPVALALRWPQTVRPSAESRDPDRLPAGVWRSVLTHAPHRWLTVAGFFEYLLSGVVVSTTSLFVATRLGPQAGLAEVGIGVATVAGLLHGMRWSSDLALGPLMGALSDRIGQDNTAAAIVAVLVTGLAGAVLLPPLWGLLCLFAVLLCDGSLHVVLSAAATGTALTTSRPHAFIGVYVTTSDAGSALGPLVALSLAAALGLPALYLVGGACLACAVGGFWWVRRHRVMI